MAKDDAGRKKNTRPKDFLDWLGISASPEWKVARPLGPLLTVILAFLFVAALAAAFVTLVSIMFAGSAGLGGGALIVAVLGAPFLIWNTVIRHRTLGFQKEGHVTDVLAKAVEQLGSEKTVKGKGIGEMTVPNIEVRIGGLLSLERIAQSSVVYDKGRDHVRVIEIICAYIRENAPARNEVSYPTVQSEADGYDTEVWMGLVKPIKQDVMLALAILSRRTDQQRRIEAAHGRNDVTEADWPFERQKNQTLDRWVKAMDQYKGYRLDLNNTCLQIANLTSLNLSGVKFENSFLERANLDDIKLNGANLSGARLNGANLMGAELNCAYLTTAQLNRAHLMGAQLNGADLVGVQLIETGLFGTQLNEANLSGAEFKGAYLMGTQLNGAHLDGYNLTADQIGVCHGDSRTQLPEGMPRPQQWPEYSNSNPFEE